MEKSLIAAGFVIGPGTSLDIMHLKSLGIAYFNVGISYSAAHTPECRADLRILERQLERVPSFIMAPETNSLWMKV
jgi:hypothetical protein